MEADIECHSHSQAGGGTVGKHFERGGEKTTRVSNVEEVIYIYIYIYIYIFGDQILCSSSHVNNSMRS